MKFNLKPKLILVILVFNIFTFSVTAQEEVVAEPTMTFKDVLPDDNFYPAIEYLASRGIFRGYPDGNFGKEAPMNRAELITIMVRMQNIEPDAKEYHDCFPDVKEEWFAPYICYSKEKNWIKGYDDGLFRPSKETSLFEAMKIIFEPLFGKEISTQTQEFIKTNIQSFEDGDENRQNAWYAPYVSFDIDKNIMGISRYAYLNRFVDVEEQRQFIAELIFKAILVKEQGWDRYDYYLSDLFLLENDMKDLLIDQDLCHSGKNIPEEIIGYIKDKYQIDRVISEADYDDEWLNSEKWPFFEISELCLLREGGFLLLGSSITEDKKINQHLIRFDKFFKSTQETLKECKNEPILLNSPPRFVTEKMDPKTFQLDSCLFAHDDERFYFHGIELEDSNGLNSKQLTFPFITDHENVYFTHMKLPDANPKTFIALVPQGELLFETALYSKDDQHAYYREDIIEEADASTFEVLDLPETTEKFEFKLDEGVWIKYYFDFIDALSFAKDKNGVYFKGRKLEGIDPASFEVIDQTYLKDKNGVYRNYYSSTMAYHDYYGYQLDKIMDADPETFIPLNNFYSKDNKALYYEDLALEFADPMTAKILEDPSHTGEWLKTKENLYFRGRLIKTFQLDLGTIEIIDDSTVRDANGWKCEIEYSLSICEQSIN